jgi:addiction module HigA family antidote
MMWIMRTTIEVSMKMHNPPHPGEVLKSLCLDPMKLTVTQAARALGVSRKTLYSIVNGRSGVTPEMAVRLSIAFDTSAESWLDQQLEYDLWHAEKRRKKLHVTRLTAA